ncbi:hypothetical protein [Hallella colorans]|uniref:hypothetical protein n=1 Tax=Hallella colorans TaxID=1703337 RepID=UPI0023F57F09|nr:hypothetical protein [Hallella colorans]
MKNNCYIDKIAFRPALRAVREMKKPPVAIEFKGVVRHVSKLKRMLYAPDTFVWRHHRALSFVLPRLRFLSVAQLYILGFQNNDVKEKMGKGMPPVGFKGGA